jgi:ABC-2 type transport system permease protein
VTFYFKNAVSFVNLALAAFVVAAVAVRFVFPSISLEGKAFWILKTSPLRLRRVWWSKFWTGFLPLFVLGELLVMITNTYLNVMPQMMWLSSATLGMMMLGIVSLGLAVGATYPRFDADNAARVAAGPGGLIYMVLCMSFVGAVVVLEAWPVYVLFTTHLRGTPLTLLQWAGVIASLGCVAILCAAVFLVSMRRGMRQLEAIEV